MPFAVKLQITIVAKYSRPTINKTIVLIIIVLKTHLIKTSLRLVTTNEPSIVKTFLYSKILPK